MIAVTFALPSESADFTKLLQNPIRGRIGEAEFSCGSIDGKHVCVLHTGVGRKACEPRVRDFLAHHRAALVISSGFAGALSNQFAVGDLLLAENFSAAQLVEPARRALAGRATVGRLVTAELVVEAGAVRERLAAEADAIAVDMETEFIASACRAAQVPLISLRAISDTPAAPLPAPGNVLFDVSRQKTSVATLAGYIARHPSALWRLAQFARRIGVVRTAMTMALSTLIHLQAESPSP